MPVDLVVVHGISLPPGVFGGPYVEALARRIALFPAESIEACKRAVYASIDQPIDEALKDEAYWLYQATSQTPALARFKTADEGGFQLEMQNQRNWNDLLLEIQKIHG